MFSLPPPKIISFASHFRWSEKVKEVFVFFIYGKYEFTFYIFEFHWEISGNPTKLSRSIDAPGGS